MAKCTESAIKEAAYYIWQKAGSPAGRDEEFWWMAVEQINGGKNPSSCAASKSAAPKKAAVKSASAAAKKPAAPKKAASAKK